MMFDLSRIPDAVRHERGVSRRLFMTVAAALAATPVLGRIASAQPATTRPAFNADPFTLGVCSGDPDHQSVVLWTRLAPDPLTADYGMDPKAVVSVSWELASDEAMRNVVKRGTTTAAGTLGHSVHVEVDGLEPDRWYWYRFRAGDAESPIGRTRTMPLPDATPGALNFAFASCQHFEAGYYTAYQHMAKDASLDCVVHLGDYIYEGAAGTGGVRKHAGPRLMTLNDYRIRHAQYRSDPNLQGVHQHVPWFVTWDDHEVSNNYANNIDGRPGVDPAKFLQRRAAAYQAYYEAMPLRARSLPKGPNMQLFRSASFGKLANFQILDTRQYRSDQANGDQASPINAEAEDAKRTIMGARQREWLERNLVDSNATWNVIAQQVMIGMLARPPANAEHAEMTYSMDSWAGYTHDRIELVKFLQDRKIANPVVLTGDVHANYVNELRVDDRQADRPVVASEFVGTSISSGGDGGDNAAQREKLMSDNAGLRWHNRQRGYVKCTVTPREWRSDYVTLDKVTTAEGQATVPVSFVVEAGSPKIQKA